MSAMRGVDAVSMGPAVAAHHLLVVRRLAPYGWKIGLQKLKG